MKAIICKNKNLCWGFDFHNIDVLEKNNLRIRAINCWVRGF